MEILVLWFWIACFVVAFLGAVMGGIAILSVASNALLTWQRWVRWGYWDWSEAKDHDDHGFAVAAILLGTLALPLALPAVMVATAIRLWVSRQERLRLKSSLRIHDEKRRSA